MRRRAPGAGVGIAIGDRVLSLEACVGLGLLDDGVGQQIAHDHSLNGLMSQGNAVAAKLRQAIADKFKHDNYVNIWFSGNSLYVNGDNFRCNSDIFN